MKIAINGLGRIGSLAVRAVLERDDLELVAINDPFITPEAMAYNLQFDTVHGRSQHQFNVHNQCMEVLLYEGGQQRVAIFHEKDPAHIQWAAHVVECVLDCTGQFLTQERAQPHIKSGAQFVVMSAPSQDATPMFVMGVNHQSYQGQKIVSNASCTTNCLAPIAKVLHENFGIATGLMTTVHAITASQKVTDSLVSKDFRLGRAAYHNIIPASTGAAKAVGKVLPALNGKLTGMAFRVPIQDVSVVDLTCQLKKPADLEAITAAMTAASENELSGVLAVTDQAMVSSDFIGNPHTSVYDANASLCLTPTFVKVIAWYDNEWAYTHKLLDLACYIRDYQES